jgi:N-acetyl-beta-hexosaminidase
MKVLSSMVLLLVLVASFWSCKQATPDIRIVPEPASIAIDPKMVMFPSALKIFTSSNDSMLLVAAGYLGDKLGITEFQTGVANPGNCIYLDLAGNQSDKNPEGYSLVTGKSGIIIRGYSARGVFYGIQTLLQLLPPEVYGENGLISIKGLRIPQVEIDDEPRYRWRGMHLEVDRYLFSVDFIKKYIDLLAMHKLNCFHWHLADSGLYAQEQIREVVAYATSRFVDVIPEISWPITHFYFNLYQGDPRFEPKAFNGFLTLEQLYSYEPTPEELRLDQGCPILGAQGNVLTEYIETGKQVEYMVLPRMSALAEVVWSPKELRDYEKFTHRMNRQYQRFDALKCNYRIPPPYTQADRFIFTDSLVLDLKSSVQDAVILYTLDGSDPLTVGKVFSQPLVLRTNTLVKAVTRMKSGQISVIAEIQVETAVGKE